MINIIPIVWTERKIENKNGEMAIFLDMVNIHGFEEEYKSNYGNAFAFSCIDWLLYWEPTSKCSPYLAFHEFRLTPIDVCKTSLAQLF